MALWYHVQPCNIIYHPSANNTALRPYIFHRCPLSALLFIDVILLRYFYTVFKWRILFYIIVRIELLHYNLQPAGLQYLGYGNRFILTWYWSWNDFYRLPYILDNFFVFSFFSLFMRSDKYQSRAVVYYIQLWNWKSAYLTDYFDGSKAFWDNWEKQIRLCHFIEAIYHTLLPS